MTTMATPPPTRKRRRHRSQRRRLLETLTGVPATEGNLVEVLRDGDEIFPAMLEAIHSAERSIDFLSYVYWRGEITERFMRAFCERARDGVRVRVVLDAFGTHPMDPRQRDEMRRAGVQLIEFRPFGSWMVWRMNMRTHRRVLVCDETVAFTGGVGIAQEWVDGGEGATPAWRDTHFRIRGPAVTGIHAAFLADWIESDEPLLGRQDLFPQQPQLGTTPIQALRAASEVGWNEMALAIRGLLEIAEEHVRITTAYFRPPRSFRQAVVAAARRGVRVQILVPGPYTEPVHYRWAAEYHYGELLDGGVEIWHYQPAMLHSKVTTVDGELALVGTTNFDARSIALNEQVGLVIHDPDVVRTLDAHFEQDLGSSHRMDREEWAERSVGDRAKEWAAHTFTYPIRGAGAGG